MPINNLYDPFKDYVEDSTRFVQNIDVTVNTPQQNPIPKEDRINVALALKNSVELFQTEIHNLNQNIVQYCRLRDDVPGPNGANMTVVQVQDVFEDNVNKCFTGIRMIQQGITEGLRIHLKDLEIDTPLLIQFPTFGVTESIDATNMKAIEVFTGDDTVEIESEKLRTFLRCVYDICRGKITEEGCKSGILRRLGGTALRLIDRLTDSYRQPDGTIPPNMPSLTEIAHLLEKRYLIDSTPAIANAKLAVLKKDKAETFTALEGKISLLVSQAALGQPLDSRSLFIHHKEIDVFKNALETKDRDIINTENKSRAQNNIKPMNLPQMVDFFNKDLMEKQTYEQISAIQRPSYDKESEISTVLQVQEPQNVIQQKITTNNSKNPFRGNFQTKKRGFYQNQGDRNAYMGAQRPRKFVTPDMAAVQNNACLACGNFDHKFTETDKCPYGLGTLQTSPCSNCGKGAHHFSLCVVGKKPTVGGTRINPQKGQTMPKTGLEQKSKQQLYDPFAHKHEKAPSVIDYKHKYTSWVENQQQANENYDTDADFNVWELESD